jgi:hypothetical protein
VHYFTHSFCPFVESSANPSLVSLWVVMLYPLYRE